MTRVEFFDHEGRITGFCCSGHSGYAEESGDVVCAAVSTADKLADYPDYIDVVEVQNDA